jgi:hypothetical protein
MKVLYISIHLVQFCDEPVKLVSISSDFSSLREAIIQNSRGVQPVAQIRFDRNWIMEKNELLRRDQLAEKYIINNIFKKMV